MAPGQRTHTSAPPETRTASGLPVTFWPFTRTAKNCLLPVLLLEAELSGALPPSIVQQRGPATKVAIGGQK